MSSKGYTELEAEVVEAFDVICVVSVRSEAVVGCEVESEIILRERIYCESDFRRDVESPVVLSVHEGGHIGTLCRIFCTNLGFKVWLEHGCHEAEPHCGAERNLIDRLVQICSQC